MVLLELHADVDHEEYPLQSEYEPYCLAYLVADSLSQVAPTAVATSLQPKVSVPV